MKIFFALLTTWSICALIKAEDITTETSSECKPSNWNKGKMVPCEAFGTAVPTGELYTVYNLFYNVMSSPYYAARMADALGYDQCCPGKNSTLLKEMNLMTPFSGAFGTIAIDAPYGFDRNILRRCIFPTGTYPFICRGSAGTPGTRGEELGTIGYTSILHDNENNRWTLFGQCWNAKTPENPNAKPIASSWNVFSLDPFVPSAAKKAIIAKIKELGFSTKNIIEPDYSTNPNALCC